MNISNKRLNAVHSHFVAQREKCVAELDVMLNSYTGSVNIDSIITVFERLALANMALSNIQSIVADNSVPEPTENGLDFSQIEQMNRMAEAIKDKLSESRQENKSKI